MDLRLAEHFGMTPAQVDDLALRDAALMLEGARRRGRAHLLPAALTATYIYNYGGLRGKGFKTKGVEELFPALFDARPGGISEEEMAEMQRRHEERLLKEHGHG